MASGLQFSALNTSVSRIDLNEKVTGSLRYFTDMRMDDMLYGAVFRSSVAHAVIESLDVSSAKSLPGVRAVLTHRDIDGVNAYGGLITEAPVLAQDRVRYFGEPIALIAADTEELANEAKEHIRIRYRALPPVRSIDDALREGHQKVHDSGNLARHLTVKRGDAAGALSRAPLVLEREYRTSMQKHMFLETEAGMAYVDERGVVNLFCSGQGAYWDMRQVARTLGISEEMVRVVNYPEGGAFGGKDEITIQIYLALLAFKSRKPVKLVLSREESGAAGYHRHASRILLRMGVDRDGRMLASEAHIYLDTGAYQTYGPNILDVTMETINGKYRIPNISVDGYLIYTNNGMASAFRGFGAPQGNFALENMVDELAIALDMDPIEFRLKNLLNDGETGPLGATERGMEGARLVLEMARGSPFRGPEARSPLPWIRNGVGLSFAVKGVGYGPVDDLSTAAVEVLRDGHVCIYFSNADYGQGISTGHAQIVAQKLELPVGSINVIHADSKYAPDTGSSNASRSTFTGGNALLLACDKAISSLGAEAAEALDTPYDRIVYQGGAFRSEDGREITIFEAASRAISRGHPTKFNGTFKMPRVERPIEGMHEAPKVVNGYAAMLSTVEVNLLTGAVTVKGVDFYVDIGAVINPLIAMTQCEGGIIQGLGYALHEDYRYDDAARPLNANYTTYIVPSTQDVPPIGVHFVDTREELGPYGAKGVGEIPIVPVASSISNAIRNAIGVSCSELPMDPPRVIQCLDRRSSGTGRHVYTGF
ncbi:MAG: xanthine dehydrogenase family protein molybdopterin-binding subunit [Nitrososphaerota archaeon]|nr:xanthine dehydrogenase family protein molybdopterin-binding subunit [Nitrososphaerota archaeon]